MIMCGGTLVGGNGGRGIGRISSSLLLMPQCRLPDRLLPLCKWRRLEPRPENEFNTDFPFNYNDSNFQQPIRYLIDSYLVEF